jgi:ubiquinone/menaquinone biosynthesis C-methylase UbiE
MPRAMPADQSTPAASPWALGDYHRFATEFVWGVGPLLVQACGIGPGQRVLDVAAGTGNAAIRAAEAGADVVACDITPENFEAGRREARARGVEVDWVEGDAQDLPFGDDAFDAVISSFGVMFAPDHRAAAAEMVRACRPGGTIGVINFRPTGTAAAFFAVVGAYAPPPPEGGSPPILWGDEAHVRELFSGRLRSLEMTAGRYVERAPDPLAYCDFYKQTFGPIVAISAVLQDDPERRAAFDRDLLDFAARENRGDPGGPAEYAYDYLLAVGRV